MTPYTQGFNLQTAFMQIGLPMMSTDFSAKLLAYVLVMGGGNEAVTHNEAMNAGIGMAAATFNIAGGQVPNVELLPLLNKRIRELEDDMENTEWLPEIGNRYNLRIDYGSYGTPSNPRNDEYRWTKRGGIKQDDLFLLLHILNS